MTIVGLGGLQDDGACAVLQDGTLRAAIEESKINRGARRGVPEAALAECMRLAGVARDAVDCVAVVRPVDPTLHFSLRELFPKAEVAVVEHHLAHAASAFFASPFEEATVLTLDHTGDFSCGARWQGRGNQLRLDREWQYPDSPAWLYSAVTELLGFKAGADEHKVQWLSTSGDDRFTPLFREILAATGRLDDSFFDGNRAASGRFSAKFFERLGVDQGSPIPAALAASVAHGLQRAIEETVLAMAGEGGNLCLAGGLFYNALLVEFLECSGRWKNVFVQPAAGNSGTALGGALYVWHQRQHHTQRGAASLLLGPSYGQEEIKKVLENCKLRFRYLRSVDELLATAVGMLGERKIVAWMQGRMEFGPRALGNRSILASPLDPYSTENLNVFIKHREPFRKFAASVPAELAAQYFDVGSNARNLASVGRVKPEHRKTFATAILGEDIVRVHTVSQADNPLYHRLLHEAGKSTGLPVLYNTSFNLFGDPLVSTPRDAVRSFYSSGIDALFVGNFVVEK
jgi:carbamoyltransferase